MTGRTTTQAGTNMTLPVALPGTEAIRLTSGPAGRPYYSDKEPALFR
jgi:hypothetical protein